MLSGSVLLNNKIPVVMRQMHEELLLAVNDLGEQIVETAQSNLYPGHGFDTGELHDSIHYDHDHEDGGTVYADAPYAGYVEFGTKNMAAIPFLLPAMAQATSQLVTISKLRMRKVLP